MDKHDPQPRLIGHTWQMSGAATLQIISVVKTRCEPGHYATGKPSLEWLLDYSLTPFGRYKVKSPRSSWQPRHAFEAHLYTPGSRKWEDTTAVRLSYTESIFITFLGGERAGLADLVNGRGYARFRDPSRSLQPLLERILRNGLELDDQGYWRAQAALYELVALLRASEYREAECYVVPEQDDCASPFTEFTRDVRLYLRDHLSEAITRRDLADHLHISVATLANRYRAEAGETPLDTLTRLRINLAKSLILRGYRLKTIADHTGFCDEFHLSRVFKQSEGVSPRDYRKQQLTRVTHSS